MQKRRIPEFGIEIIEGLPGSGKTLMCVRRVLEAVEQHRRPVYTNLPLRWRVVREYLANRGGPHVADLVRPLSREVFTTFVERFAKYADRVEAWKAEAKAAGVSLPGPEIERRWLEEQGANVISGEGQNWIPAGSIVCLDEVHSWFSMREQSKETPALQRYLTMHRHMVHWVWAVAQDRATLSITFRRFAAKVWQVRDMRNDKLAWGLKFGHLGVHAIGYSCFTGDQIDGRTADNATPLANYVLLPWLPKNSRFFRFYDGFSHVGKLGALVRQVEQTRVASGLAADGSDVADERVQRHRRRERERRSKVIGRMVRFVRRAVIRVGVLGAVAFVAFVVGKSGEGAAPVVKGEGESGATVQVAAAGEGGKGGTTEPAPVKWPRWEGVGRGYVRIEGKRVDEGGKVGEADLVHIDDKPRALVLLCRGDVWLWRWGESEPRRVGPVDQVRGVVESRRAESLRRSRHNVPSESPGGSVVAPEGDVLGE